jgi:hypothetical protein
MTRATTAAALALLLGLAPVAAAQEPGPETRRVSSSPSGAPGDDASEHCAVAAGGAVVAFDSGATDLVAGDTNDLPDVFAWEESGQTTRVSVASGGRQAGSTNGFPDLSASGRYMSFTASSHDLRADEDHWSFSTAFVHDRRTGVTENVSVRSDGGRANGESGETAISGNGRFVVFSSDATNLAAKGDRNRFSDIFVHDRKTGKTNRVSLSTELKGPNDDSDEPAISADGRYVAFKSWASNLVRRDLNGDTGDIFVYDRTRRTTRLVTMTSAGEPSRSLSWDPAISGDGRYVSFTTDGVLVDDDVNRRRDVYVHDAFTGLTELVSAGADGPGNHTSEQSSISDDGRYVAFLSTSDNLVLGDMNGTYAGWDVFVRDLVDRTTTLVSVGNDGRRADRSGGAPDISPDGRYVCWETWATNLDDEPREATSENIYVRGPLWDE